MRILVINPNTNPENTKVIAAALLPYQTGNLRIDVINPERGPVGLESYYHYDLAAIEVHKLVVTAEEQGYDGVVIACFGDPAVEAAKELVKIPVVGMAEASYALARLLATKFLVISDCDTAVPRQIRYIKKLGIPDYQYAVIQIELTVLDVMDDRAGARDSMITRCRQALKETSAELIIMGCSAFSGLRSELEKELRVPVIDPVVAGVHVCVALVQMSVSQSKALTYRTPPNFEIKP
jgi:allantoin racemase